MEIVAQGRGHADLQILEATASDLTARDAGEQRGKADGGVVRERVAEMGQPLQDGVRTLFLNRRSHLGGNLVNGLVPADPFELALFSLGIGATHRVLDAIGAVDDGQARHAAGAERTLVPSCIAAFVINDLIVFHVALAGM